MLGASIPAATMASSRASAASFSRSTSVAYSTRTDGSSVSSSRSKKRWVVRTASAYAAEASRIAMIVLSAMGSVISPGKRARSTEAVALPWRPGLRSGQRAGRAVQEGRQQPSVAGLPAAEETGGDAAAGRNGAVPGGRGQGDGRADLGGGG